jgi:CheY-like chemotaxis protein
MKLQSASNPNLDNARAIIDRQTNQMVRLVDDLLDLSRITRGRIQLQKEAVSLAATLSNALETCRPLIEMQQHELRIHLPHEPIYIGADSARAAQILANLLNNAAKYTPPRGRIEVVASNDQREACVVVRDTGVGIAPDMLDTIFEMFTQVDTSLTRSQGGLGIGLTLAKKLAELHGGRIEARSSGLGRGSEFVVYLPLSAQAVQAVTTTDIDSPQEHARRILIADDNIDAAQTLGLLLELQGHTVRTASDGVDAIALFQSFDPDVVLLDIGMPRMDGYTTASRIRSLPAGKTVTLLALTGWGQFEDKRKAFAAGFDHHLTKPVDFQALDSILANVGAGTSR